MEFLAFFVVSLLKGVSCLAHDPGNRFLAAVQLGSASSNQTEKAEFLLGKKTTLQSRFYWKMCISKYKYVAVLAILAWSKLHSVYQALWVNTYSACVQPYLSVAQKSIDLHIGMGGSFKGVL